ncbi:MAG: hypothetical protein AAB677_00185 [Patescibacteria group bacterium]
MSDPIPVERLAEARQAMEGEERRKKRELENQNLFKRREEARRAMEGEERRRKHETEAVINRANQEKATAAAAAETATLALARQTAQSAVAAEREKEMKAATVETARRRQAEATATQIAKLKNTPLMMESIRTLKTDLTQATAHGATITQAIIRGQNQSFGSPAVSNQSRRGRGRLLFLTLILLLVGAGALVYLYWFKIFPPVPPAAPPPISPAAVDQLFISTDQQIKIALDSLTPAATILKLRPALADGPTTAGQLIRIIPTKTETALTWSAWLAALPEVWPEKLKQTFEPKFLFGRYDDSNQPTVFLLLKIKNYNETFAALRAAETELAAFFYLLTGRAVFSPSTTTPVFNNQLDRNLETRRLIKDGRTILLYAFLDQNFFVLTENERAFGEIVNRWDDSVLLK